MSIKNTIYIIRLFTLWLLAFGLTSSFLFSQVGGMSPVCGPCMEKPPSVTKPFIYLPPEHHGTVIATKGKKAVSQESSKSKTLEDSTVQENTIEIREGQGNIYIYLDLVDYKQRLKIYIYNLLGKIVLEDLNYYPIKDVPYKISEDRLQNGMYLCVVQGENFRLRQKFIVSR